jgi:DNA-binding transcriptional LysR family regulator
MELRELRYVLAIDKTGNLSRAAEVLHVSQPALSYALRKLESELGVQIFDRHSGGVKPTVAGKDVISAAKRTVREADRIAELARAHADGQRGVLRIGFEATGAGELTTRARSEFTRTHPAVRVQPKRYDWGGEADALRDGAVDAAFLWLPADTSGMHVEVVHTEPRIAAVWRGHRLARRKSISILDIRDDPLMWTDKAPRAWVDWWAVNPRPDGSAPVWGPTNDNVEEMLEQVAEGRAVCIVPESMGSFYGRPDLCWIPIADIEPLRVALAWMKPGSKLVSEFAAVVRELASR